MLPGSRSQTVIYLVKQIVNEDNLEVFVNSKLAKSVVAQEYSAAADFFGCSPPQKTFGGEPCRSVTTARRGRLWKYGRGTPEKRQVVVRATQRYLAQRHLTDRPLRFDVVAIDNRLGQPPVVRLHKDVFSHKCKKQK